MNVAEHEQFLVVADDSELAATVIEHIKAHAKLPISLCDLHHFSKDIQLQSQYPLIMVVDGQQSTQQTKQLLSQPCPLALLISDDAKLLAECHSQVTDILLWPEPLGLLAVRLNILQRLSTTHDRFIALRHKLNWHKSRVQREHQLIEHIFQNALSRNYLDYPHIRTYLTPVSTFNGDLCLVAPGPLGNLYVLMADFTGHGLAPATGALPLSQAFFAMTDRGVSVAEMVTEFNYRLNRLLPTDMFCAAILLELSANGERVTYWNGGMPEALLFNQAGDVLKRMQPQHMALGVLDDEDFDSHVTTFRTPIDSSIALFTDGVIELLGEQREFLGSAALESLIKTYPSTDDFPEFVQELERFRGATPLRDDLSLAILSCRPTELDEVEEEDDLYGLPFDFNCQLNAEQLKHIEPIGYLVAALSHLPRMHRHRTVIYLLLAEVFNNALEHGLLGLDSRLKNDPEGFSQYYHLRAERLDALTEGTISIGLSYCENSRELTVMVADTGDGFTLNITDPGITRSYGRGLELLAQMTTELTWDQNNRQVSFKYAL